MSWSGKTKARRFAAPGEIAALFASCRAMSGDSPLGQSFLNALGSIVNDAVAKTPHDGDITVETYGHVPPDGLSGSFTVTFSFGPHVMPTPVAPIVSDAVPPTDPAVVGSIPASPPVAAPPVVPEQPSVPASAPVEPVAPPAEGSVADAVGLTPPSIPAPPAP